MPLVEVELPNQPIPLPPAVRELLAEADQRIDAFLQRQAASEHGFVTSDFVAAYNALQQIADGALATGSTCCEWGSGFGVVTLLAALVGFDAYGIEVDPELVAAACDLADDSQIPATFVRGSFVPPGGESIAEATYSTDDYGPVWISTDSDDAYNELELEPDDFDLIYAYPWPGEAECIEQLFQRYAADGALLLTYAHLESMRLLRKVS